MPKTVPFPALIESLRGHVPGYVVERLNKLHANQRNNLFHVDRKDYLAQVKTLVDEHYPLLIQKLKKLSGREEQLPNDAKSGNPSQPPEMDVNDFLNSSEAPSPRAIDRANHVASSAGAYPDAFLEVEEAAAEVDLCVAPEPLPAPAEEESGSSTRGAPAFLILGDNGKRGAQRRWLVKWEAENDKRKAQLEPARRIPAHGIATYEESLQKEFNCELWPQLVPSPMSNVDRSGDSGVVATSVNPRDAAACAAYLQAHWKDGQLKLDRSKAQGYRTYAKTLEDHNGEEQSQTTLLITKPLLQLCRTHVEGFKEMEEELANWLHDKFGTGVREHASLAITASAITAHPSHATLWPLRTAHSC